MNDEVPDHSTFSKNRHGRFKESGIFQEIFDEIVRKLCIKIYLYFQSPHLFPYTFLSTPYVSGFKQANKRRHRKLL